MPNVSTGGTRQNVYYPLTINYDLELEELESRGRYDRTICTIDPESKPPTEKRGSRFAQFELINLNRRVTNGEAERTLRKLGYYPADAHSLLTFGIHYPYIQQKMTVAGIAHTLKVYYRHNTRPKEYQMTAFPLLLGDESGGRVLDFKDRNSEWSEMTHFLVTKDKSMKTGSWGKLWKRW